MQFYYIDRLNSLPVGSTVNLHQFTTNNLIEVDNELHDFYKFGVNNMAQTYFSTCDLSDPKNIITFTTEYIFELVRRTEFPYLPSRFTALYASKDIEDLKKWYKILSKNKKYDCSKSTIKLIEVDNYITVDSFWRDETLHFNNMEVFNPFSYHYYAQQYWSRRISTNPMLEVLCIPPIKVIKQLPINLAKN